MKSANSEAKRQEAQMVQVFGFKVPVSGYYLHRSHTWVVFEGDGRARVGMDDFSQKIMGPAEALKLPEVGREYYQNHICMSLIRQGTKASFEAPVDGAIEALNPKVQERPALVHDDPYGEGWLYIVRPNNVERNLANLMSGMANAAWIDQEAHRLLTLMDQTVGVTLPAGGEVIDDVYGHYPELGWRRLVKEFFVHHMTSEWKQRARV